MNIISYMAEHVIFRDSLRKYLDKEIVPHIETWEEAGIVPRNVWKKNGGTGVFAGTKEIMKTIAAKFMGL
jgi:acyl-CoA dehydrogenase